MGPDDIGVGIVEIDLEDIDRTRIKLPAINNIRKDLYSIVVNYK